MLRSDSNIVGQIYIMYYCYLHVHIDIMSLQNSWRVHF